MSRTCIALRRRYVLSVVIVVAAVGMGSAASSASATFYISDYTPSVNETITAYPDVPSPAVNMWVCAPEFGCQHHGLGSDADIRGTDRAPYTFTVPPSTMGQQIYFTEFSETDPAYGNYQYSGDTAPVAPANDPADDVDDSQSDPSQDRQDIADSPSDPDMVASQNPGDYELGAPSVTAAGSHPASDIYKIYDNSGCPEEGGGDFGYVDWTLRWGNHRYGLRHIRLRHGFSRRVDARISLTLRCGWEQNEGGGTRLFERFVGPHQTCLFRVVYQTQKYGDGRPKGIITAYAVRGTGCT